MHRGPPLPQARYMAAFQAPSAVQQIGRRQRDQRHFRTGCIAVNIKKILTWAGVAFLLFFLFSAPVQAGNLVNNILGSLQQAAQAVIVFMQNIFV